MERFVNSTLVAGLLLLSGAQTAHGFGGRGMRVTAAYFPVCAPPVSVASVLYYVPAPFPYLAAPRPEAAIMTSPTASPFATPTPAPPSQTAEPPTGFGPKQAPKVSESQGQANSSPAITAQSPSLKELCRVGFWNLTERDMTIKVDGQAHALARGRALTLSLGRQFVWQVDARAPAHERIPDDQSTLELVIRR